MLTCSCLPCPSFATQTTTKQPAKAVTGEEMKDVLRSVRAKINKCYKQRPQDFKKGAYVHWDRATWHSKNVSDVVFGRSRKPHVTVRIGPPVSPDLNKPAEHAINLIKRKVSAYLGEHTHIKRWQEIQKVIRDEWYKLKVQGFRKDILSMPELYEQVNKGKKFGGSGGDYVSKKH